MISSSFGWPRGWLRSVLAVAAIFLAWGLAACSSDVPIEQKYPKERLPGDSKPRYEDPQNTIFGPGGLLGGGGANKNGDQGGHTVSEQYGRMMLRKYRGDIWSAQARRSWG